MSELVIVALIGLLGTVFSSTLAFLTYRRVGVVETNTNHKMDVAIEAVRGRALAEGKAEGRQAEHEELVDDERREREEAE